MNSLWVILFVLLVFIPIFIVLVIACSLCADAAKNRGRSYSGWLWIALLSSPLLAAVLLIALGETTQKRRERIMEEEELRELVRRKNIHQESTPMPERNFNPYAKTTGDMYRR